MKRTLARLLALLLALSLCACGGDTSADDNASPDDTATVEPSPESETTVYQVGDTVSDGSMEFTLDSFSFHQCLSNFGDENYLNPIEPDDEVAYLYYKNDNPYCADEDEIVVRLEFTQKNVGKSPIAALSGACSTAFSLEFGDGYEFGRGWFGAGSKTESGDYSSIKMEPLSDSVPGRAAVTVPKKLMEDESQPLLLIFTPSKSSRFVYKIR